MPENTVKRSFDVSKDDQNFIEDYFPNYAEWLRRKTREKKHEAKVSNHTKTVLLETIEAIVEKGEELREEVDQKWEELKEEYDAEIIGKSVYYINFKIDGEKYTTGWGGQHVEPYNPNQEVTDKADKFASKYTDVWQNKIGEHNDYINEETRFSVSGGGESTQTIYGQGMLEDYKLVAQYVVENLDGIDIHYQDSIDVPIEDLETAREIYENKSNSDQ